MVAVLALSACSLSGSGVRVEGDLKLLYAPFSLQKLPQYWRYVENPLSKPPSSAQRPNQSPLFWGDVDQKIALGVSPSHGPAEIGRRTNVAILGSPYLSYSWQLTDGAQPGDVSLVLGFRNQDVGDWNEGDFGAGLPNVDQVLRIPIGGPLPDAPGTGAQKNVAGRPLGDMTNPAAPQGWQTDYLDLATLHRRYWPDIDLLNVKLVWIGIATTEPKRPNATGVTYLSHILLSR